MFSYILLTLYLIAAGLNLAAAKKKTRLLFGVTKPLLLPLLALYALSRGAPEPDGILIAALLACFAGDVLLMFNGDAWFVAGGVSFFAGHVLLIVSLVRRLDFGGLPLAALIPAAIAYAGVAVFVTVRIRKNAPKLTLPCLLAYLLCNAATSIFALALLVQAPGVWSALSFLGAVLFFLSDAALFLLRFEPGRPRFFKTDFFVMLTYILAVLLITAGLQPIV